MKNKLPKRWSNKEYNKPKLIIIQDTSIYLSLFDLFGNLEFLYNPTKKSVDDIKKIIKISRVKNKEDVSIK